MAQRWTEVTRNYDTVVTCGSCGQEYFLLRRVSGEAGGWDGNTPTSAELPSHEASEASKEKVVKAALPLWQRCYHCGDMSDEGASQARRRKSQALCGDPHGELTEDINTSFNLFVGSGSLAVLAVLFLLLGWESVGGLCGFFAGIVGLFVVLQFPYWCYYRFFWDPQTQRQLNKWKEWWEREGKREFDHHVTEAKALTWEPEVY